MTHLPVRRSLTGRARRGVMHRSNLALTTLVAILLVPPSAPAQDVTEPALKAAFVYNFLKFTEWPEPVPASDPFVICVVHDTAVSEALERLVKDRKFAGRRLKVARIEIAGPLRPCRVLYVSGLARRQEKQLLADLNNAPVLTIGDAAAFTEDGGMVQLFFERGLLRFDIGLPAVKRSRLQMSSRLLSLAKRP